MRIPSIILFGVAALPAADIEFPADAGQASVTAFGAMPGDGVDDTAAIQAALDATFPVNDGGNPANNRTLYLPAGSYDVSGTISWRRWVTLRGAGPGRTIIRLKDNAAGFAAGANKPVLHAYYSDNTSFGNYIEGLTVDTGHGNPGAIGIRWNNHNEGALRDVVIRSGDGQGAIGLDQTENEFGPALVRNVTIDGFDRGVVTVGSVSHCTYYNLTLLHQRVVGFDNNLPVSIYNLVSTNTVPALRNNDFYLAQVVLVHAILGGGAGGSAIVNANSGGVCLREVSTTGYARALTERGVDRPGAGIDEYLTDERPTAFSDVRTGHLRLPVEEAPAAVVEPVTAWATPAGGSTAQVQAAFNGGAATVYFCFGQGYAATTTLVIPASVKRVVGMRNGVSSSYGQYQDHLAVDQPVVRVIGNTTEPLVIEGFSFARWPYDATRPGIEIASNRPVVLRSCGGGQVILPHGYQGRVWLEDTHSDLRILGTQRVWASHYNVENNPNGNVPDRQYVWNAGGTFWCLGMKTESFATHIVTSAGGRSELLGAFFRDHDVPPGDSQPYFRTTDGELTATYLAYDWGGGHDRGLHAVETRQGVTHEVRLTPGTRRIGLYAAGTAAIVPPALPTPWSSQTVGVADPAGAASASNGVFTIVGSGADIWGVHDSFRAVAQPISGDCDLVARVDSVSRTSAWAKAGVMLRAALQDDAAHAMTVVTASNGVAFQCRASAGNGSVHVAGSKAAAPRWVRISRRGNLFSSYESSNGTTWALIGSRTITMPATLQACLVVTSHSSGVLCTAVIAQPALIPTSAN